MKFVSRFKHLLLICLSLLMVFSISGCQFGQVEKPENVLLMTPEQIKFYERLYRKDMDDVLKALNLTEEDLRTSDEVEEQSFISGYYLTPEIVRYNGKEFYCLLIFSMETQAHMEPNVFRGIEFVCRDFERQEAIDFSQQVFEEALALYGETVSYEGVSIQNPEVKEEFLAGERGFTDKWYVNQNKTLIKVGGKGTSEEHFVSVIYEIRIEPIDD